MTISSWLSANRQFGRMFIPVFAALFVVATAILYFPLLNAPLEITDYSELLLVMPSSRDFIDTLAALSTYFAGHGRFLPITHGFIALNWTLFGLDSVGWQVMRAAVMLACAAAAFVLLRRFGATRGAAGAGSMFFVVPPGASEAWIRLTGEPLATFALLSAGILARHYGRTPRWRRDGLGIGILAAAAILAKETSIVVVPFVVALAWWSRGSETGSDPSLHARRSWLIATTAMTVTAALLAIALVAARAMGTADSYVAEYGDALINVRGYIRRALWIALPFPPLTAPTRLQLLRVPPNLIFLGLLTVGGLASVRSAGLLRKWAIAVSLSLVLAMAGALVYHPWPRFESFYTLPFIFGSSLALAVSLTAIERLRGSLGALGYFACTVLLFYSAMLARETVVRSVARRSVNAAVVAHVAARPAETVVLMADPSRPRQEWQSVSATVGRFAEAISVRQAPTVVGVSCATIDSARADPSPNTTLISYSDTCGTFPEQRRVILRRFQYLSWRSMSLVQDSVRADIMSPPSTRSLRFPGRGAAH